MRGEIRGHRGVGNVFIGGRRIQVIRRSDGLGRLIVD